ncbi:uncharacterized protein K02A2.6-like [Microplitis mediator]|uniref:uncharacterized protein K02A2.6-like n=1 Tax=Microplitis mediator TaxID=375433 RepID=UPI002557988B|nr:uncharacterized protein K02A2.6-like [Microplitis mediator]
MENLEKNDEINGKVALNEINVREDVVFEASNPLVIYQKSSVQTWVLGHSGKVAQVPSSTVTTQMIPSSSRGRPKIKDRMKAIGLPRSSYNLRQAEPVKFNKLAKDEKKQLIISCVLNQNKKKTVKDVHDFVCAGVTSAPSIFQAELREILKGIEGVNYASIAEPLYRLLRKDGLWACLGSHQVLMQYKPSLPVKVTCDASPFGVGAVIVHVQKDKTERPIAFASRVSSKAERGYSQLDKEALAIVFAVKTFHQYLYGRYFELETDHKPLIYIFGPKKGIPVMAARVDNKTADFLSRCVNDEKHEFGMSGLEEEELCKYTYLNYVLDDVGTIDVRVLADETKRDHVLKQVLESVRTGRKTKVEKELEPFKNRARELCLENECLMWGYRMVVPKSLRKYLLEELHSAHAGIVRMKAMARSHVWWPNIDAEIEELSQSCQLCLEAADSPPRAQLHCWNWPEEPNHRLHIDFLGPLESQMYVVIVDAHSKWVEIRTMKDIKAKATIKVLEEYFAAWGLPQKLVSDNGPAFIASEFAQFLRRYGITHIKPAPYHPASNGASENAVRSFKKKFKVLRKAGYDKDDAVQKYLFYTRATPHSTTRVSPAELQIGRKFRTRLDLIRRDVRHTVETNQVRQASHFSESRKIDFPVGSKVMIKNYRSDSWGPATIETKLSPMTYTVKTSRGTEKRHCDQIARCSQGVGV